MQHQPNTKSNLPRKCIKQMPVKVSVCGVTDSAMNLRCSLKQTSILSSNGFRRDQVVFKCCWQLCSVVKTSSSVESQGASGHEYTQQSPFLLTATLHCCRQPQHVSQVSKNLNSSIIWYYILGARVKTLRDRAISCKWSQASVLSTTLILHR